MDQETHPRATYQPDDMASSFPMETNEVGLAQLVERQLARYINADRQVMPAPNLYDRVMNEVERPLLRLVLSLVNGNKIQAAKILGINRNTLLKKLRFHGLEKPEKSVQRRSKVA